MKSDNQWWVFLDLRISKYVIKLVAILEKHNIKFLFRSTLVFFDHKFTIDEFNDRNLQHYIDSIANDKFFDGFNKIGFDFTQSVANYLLRYKCYDTFSEVYKVRKKILLSKEYDYYQNIQYYKIKREEIRNYISSLEREIKIGLLF